MTCAGALLAIALSGPADAIPASAACGHPALPAQALAETAQAREDPAAASPALAAPAPRSPELPRARDGEIAIREEYDAARRAGTREAYDLFIARHPGHPLARAAQEERNRLR